MMKNNLNAKMNMVQLRFYSVVLLVSASFMVMSCSSDETPFYVLSEARTPVLQLLQKAEDTGTAETRQDCLDLDTDGPDGPLPPKKWCQQFPVRPDSSLLLRFVVVSPEGADLKVSLDRLRRIASLSTSRDGARIGVASVLNSVESSLGDFEPTEIVALRKTVQEKPLRIQEVYFSLKLPTSQILFEDFQKSGALPGYTLNYSVSSESHRGDAGYFSFYVIPGPDTQVFDAILNGLLSSAANAGADSGNGSGQGAGLTDEVIASLKRQATSNVPPAILNFDPVSTNLGKDDESRLEITLGGDPDLDAKSRVLWFVSSGELSNFRSRRPKWKPEKNGPQTAIVVVRDLQGGVDFQIKSFEVTD